MVEAVRKLPSKHSDDDPAPSVEAIARQVEIWEAAARKLEIASREMKAENSKNADVFDELE